MPCSKSAQTNPKKAAKPDLTKEIIGDEEGSLFGDTSVACGHRGPGERGACRSMSAQQAEDMLARAAASAALNIATPASGSGPPVANAGQMVARDESTGLADDKRPRTETAPRPMGPPAVPPSHPRVASRPPVRVGGMLISSVAPQKSPPTTPTEPLRAAHGPTLRAAS